MGVLKFAPSVLHEELERPRYPSDGGARDGGRIEVIAGREAEERLTSGGRRWPGLNLGHKWHGHTAQSDHRSEIGKIRHLLYIVVQPSLLLAVGFFNAVSAEHQAWLRSPVVKTNELTHLLKI